MRSYRLKSLLVLGLIVGSVGVAAMRAQTQTSTLPNPRFHHVHFNSPDPAATMALFVKAYPGFTLARFEGQDAVKTANDIYFLYNGVTTAPAAAIPDRVSAAMPQGPFWHITVGTGDLRQWLARFKQEVPDAAARILPLYTGPDGQFVEMSGDTLPGFLTTEQLAAARAAGATPTGQFSFATWIGPDGVLMESLGAMPGVMGFALFQEQPLCAVLWYERHLNGLPRAPGGRNGQPVPPPLTDANCVVPKSNVVSWPSSYKRGHVRVPASTGVSFGGFFMNWYINQEPGPLAPMRGRAVDHFAISVPDLDAWVAKLRSENVTFLQGPEPYKLGSLRAVMIEGPSREAIELVEVRN